MNSKVVAAPHPGDARESSVSLGGETPRGGVSLSPSDATKAIRSERAGTADSGFSQKATLLLLATLTIMSGATISPSLPAIEARFSSVENVELLTRLVLTIPALSIALCAPLAGSLIDRFGRRGLLIGSILLYALAGMSGLVLDTLPGLLVGRALLGFAVAGTMTTTTALVGDYFSGPERDDFMGLQTAAVGLGGLVFLTGGGFLGDVHWRAPFAVYGIALVLLPAAALFLPEPPRAVRPAAGRAEAADRAGVGTAVAGLFLIAMLNSVAFYLIPTQLPFHLQALGAGAPSLAGLAVGMVPLASVATSLAYGRARRRIGIMGMFSVGFGLMAAGYGLIASAESYVAILVGVAVTGIGMGAVMPNLMAGAMAIASPASRGRIAGGLTASIFLGQFLSPFASQSWIASFGFSTTFRDAGALLAVIALATAAGALLGARALVKAG